MLPKVHGEFRVVADPELRFSPSGVAVGSMRMVANSRKKDESTGEWVDDKVCWLKATAFKKVAENMAESFVKGDLVVIEGRLQTEEWEKDGVKHQSYVVMVDEIGPSIRWAPARIERADRSSGGGQVQRSAAPAGEDPWASAPVAGGDASGAPF